MTAETQATVDTEGESRNRWGWLEAYRDEGDPMADAVWCKVMGAEAGDRAARVTQAALFAHLVGLEPRRVDDIMDAVGQMVMNATYAAVAVAVAGALYGATPRTADAETLERRLAFLVRKAGVGTSAPAITDLRQVEAAERAYDGFMARHNPDTSEPAMVLREPRYGEAARRAWRESVPVPLAPLADGLLPAPGGVGYRFIPYLQHIHTHLAAIDGRLYWGGASIIHGSFTCAAAFYMKRWIVLEPWLFRVPSQDLVLGVLAHEVGHCVTGSPEEAEAEAWAATHLRKIWTRYQAASDELKREKKP